MKTGKIKGSVSDKQFPCGYFATIFQLSLWIFTALPLCYEVEEPHTQPPPHKR